MERSAVPPPDANKCLCVGHHAKAFTAATCCTRVLRGLCTTEERAIIDALPLMLASHRQRKFSLPPEARVLPSGDHFNPHT